MCAHGTHQRSRGNQGTHHGPIVAPRGDARPRVARPTQGSPPGSKTSTTAAASTPASAANPPSNTNYTKRPGQKPHKQTVNNLRTTPRGPGHLPWHGGQALGARTLRVAPHDLARERAPLPVPRVCSCVASRHESSGRSAREALARGGALGAGGPGSPPSDGGSHRRCLGCVMEHCQYRALR